MKWVESKTDSKAKIFRSLEILLSVSVIIRLYAMCVCVNLTVYGSNIK